MTVMKKAVMYGAGNIGRGFIGQLLYKSGYAVTFIDIDKKVIDALNTDGEYPVNIVSPAGVREELVKNVRGVVGDTADAVAAEMEDCDIMATALGVNVLKYVAANLAAGVKRRIDAKRALNIIICENLLDADKYLKALILKELPADYAPLFDEYIGLVEASIGRMVPVMDDAMRAGNILRVYVEEYNFLPVDRDAFRGGVPVIENLYPYSPFKLFIERKLFMHNMSHALTAYLGALGGHKYIYQAMEDPAIRYIAYGALVRSAESLAKETGAELAPLLRHASNLLYRFTNAGLKDTTARVGRDTVRKLGANDRLIGAINLLNRHGVCPAYHCAGVAAALLFAGESDPASAELSAFAAGSGAAAALEKYSAFTDEKCLDLIEKFYVLLAQKAPLARLIALCEAAENTAPVL